MIQQKLVGAGEEALAYQDYFRAIQKFLLVKEHKLDLVDEVHCHGGVNAIEAVDIDNNTTKEVNIITTYGRCKIYSCGENLQKIVQLDNPSGFQELRFFKYGRGASTHSAMLVAYKKNAPPAIYHFSRQGNKISADLRSIIGIPRQQEDDLEIYCIIYKNLHLYLAASNNKIYRFNPFSPNNPDQELETPRNIRHFQIDDLPSLADANTIHNSHLVGIMDRGGIIVYDINPQGHISKTSRTFALSSLYICVQVADPDNEGSESIIACASNGKLDIYDLHTTQLKYSIKCADKFHSLYCDDIDNDGILEILVGGASNRIYVFAVDPDRRELCIKWEYPTEHRVTALWAGNIRQGDKRVIVGLTNGKLQVFKIYIGLTINQKIAQAFNDLKKSHGNKEILNWFSLSKYPAVARYGMDVLEREMDCRQVVEFLQSIEEQQVYDVNLQILQKLGYLLKKYQNEKILIGYTFEFIERLYKKYQNLPTCEQICFELEKINNVIGSGNDFLCQFKEFTEEKIRWKDLPILRSEDIKRLSSEGLFPDANKQLENLQLIGMDLLESYPRLENIEFMTSIDYGKRIILASSEGDLYRLDKGIIDKKHFNDAEIHIVRIQGSNNQYFISNGSDVFKLDSFDHLDMVKPFTNYGSTIYCLSALHHQGQDYFACGLVNNGIVIQADNGQRREYTLPAIPIKMELKVAKDKITFYVITVTGDIYRMQNIIDFLNQSETHADPFKQPWLELGDSVNVLDWVCIENEQGNPRFYVLTPDSIYSVHADGEKPKLFYFINNIDRPLISIALGKTYKGSQEIIIGTRQRSLIFLSLEGEKTKELFLADMPTAVHSLANNGTGQEIIVALAQGLVNRYRVVSPNYLKELETICNQEKGYALLWAKHTLAEKMVLIALSLGGAELTGIHDKLHRIKHFFPKDNILLGVQSLEAKKLIVSHVEQKESHYSLQDSGYAQWISTHQGVFDTALEHRQELIAAIKLIDVCKIDMALEKENQLQWVADFLLISPEKWANLVHLSIALNSKYEANQKQKELLRQNHLEILCATVKVLFQERVPVPLNLQPHLEVFEINIPSIKFQGFDCILVTVLKDTDYSAVNSWIKTTTNWRIVLVITPGENAFLKLTLKNESLSFSTAVLDYQDLKNILLANNPHEELLSLLVEQVNLVALSPFQIAGPVREMFYGRENETLTIINSILQANKKSLAIFGPRRIGKTSILMRIKDEIDKRKNFKTVYLDCSLYGTDILEWCDGLLRKLDITAACNAIGDFVTRIDEYCKSHRCKLVFFLDELDALLTDGEKFSTILRALINEASVKVVVGGYRELYFHMHDIQSPLFNCLDKMELGSLTEKDAMALIDEPFKNILTIDRINIKYITEKTACYPNFIQFCCAKLIESERIRKEREITREDIDKVIKANEFSEHMVEVYLHNLDDQSKLLLYLMMACFDKKLGKIITDRLAYNKRSLKYANEREKYILDNKYTPYQLHRLLEIYGIKLNDRELDNLMKKLVLATILKHEQESTLYSFVLPDLPFILGKHIEIELRAVSLLERINEIFPL